MTATTQTSVISTHTWRRRHSQDIYNVIVNGEDGSFQEFEVEASSFAEAEAKADRIAHESMTDITYIEVYHIA